ncbi:MAG: VOC family protein [Sphingomonadaceae bacterium]
MAWTLEGQPVAFIYTADSSRSRAFYADRLGLPVVSDDEFGMSFRQGSGLLRLTPMEGHVAGPHPVAGLDVADIEAAADGLAAAGVALTVHPGMGQDAKGIWTAPDGGARVAWFSDPDGNVLSLTEVSRAG